MNPRFFYTYITGIVLCLPIAAYTGEAIYSYDSLHRLTRVVYDADLAVSYRYDSNGNRVQKRIFKPLVLLQSPLPSARLGLDYQIGLAARDGVGETLWSMVAGHLPQGLTFDKGLIFGKPNASGRWRFRVQASDEEIVVTRDYVLDVYPPGKPGQLMSNHFD